MEEFEYYVTESHRLIKSVGVPASMEEVRKDLLQRLAKRFQLSEEATIELLNANTPEPTQEEETNA